jgi:hypothetical protein
MPNKTNSVKCVRDARAYPPECFSLPRDGRKAKHVCRQRRELFIQYATYADADGSRSWPGEKRVCEEMGLKRRTMERLVADLKELGCVVEAVGPDGKIKLHGPRGTTERLVVPDALPAPGGTPWELLPDGENVGRLVFVPSMSCTFDREGKPVWMGPRPVAPNSVSSGSAVAPNSRAVAPLSAPVAPNSKAVAPKAADFGAQPPPNRHETATTTATTASTPGEVGVGSSKSAGTRVIEFLAKELQYTALPATQAQKAAVENLTIGVPGKIMGKAIQAWIRERPAGWGGVKFPVALLVNELPDYIAAAMAAANAPPPGEMTQEEIDADELRSAQQNGFETVAEWKAWFTELSQRIAQETLGEEIMREQGLPEQGD